MHRDKIISSSGWTTGLLFNDGNNAVGFGCFSTLRGNRLFL